ncbi:TPA: hypothetical protein ACGXMZ_005011 [Bacillus albus]
MKLFFYLQRKIVKNDIISVVTKTTIFWTHTKKITFLHQNGIFIRYIRNLDAIA